VESLAYSPDGSRLAGISEREVLIWNPTTGKLLAEFMGSGICEARSLFLPQEKL